MKHPYLLLLLAFALACCDNNDPEDDPMVDTRYSAQLPQLVNNYITPELDATVNEVEALRVSAEAFDLALDQASLDAFQAQLKEARLQWQRISFLWFGPGDEQNTVREVNTFPADVMAVSAHADEGSTGGEGLDEKGFCAIGRMIHHADDQSILDYYNDDSFGASRRTHPPSGKTFVIDRHLPNIGFALRRRADDAVVDCQWPTARRSGYLPFHV